jgi:hypothetical protein
MQFNLVGSGRDKSTPHVENQLLRKSVVVGNVLSRYGSARILDRILPSFMPIVTDLSNYEGINVTSHRGSQIPLCVEGLIVIGWWLHFRLNDAIT